MREIQKEIGRRIKRLRVGRGVSQSALGKAIGVTFQQVQKYENGVNETSIERLFSITRFFSVPFGYFLDDLDDDETEVAGDTVSDHHARLRLEIARALEEVNDARIMTAVLGLVKVMTKTQGSAVEAVA
jgi:transcriptional regulator with XRE-family HTH domain